MAPDNHHERTQRPAAAGSPSGTDPSTADRRKAEVILAKRRSVRRQAARTKRSAIQGW